MIWITVYILSLIRIYSCWGCTINQNLIKIRKYVSKCYLIQRLKSVILVYTQFCLAKVPEKKTYAIYYLIMFYSIENHIAVAISDQITAIRFFFQNYAAPKWYCWPRDNRMSPTEVKNTHRELDLANAIAANVASTFHKMEDNQKYKQKQSLQMSLHLTKDLKGWPSKTPKLQMPSKNWHLQQDHCQHWTQTANRSRGRRREFCTGFPQLMPSTVASWQHGGQEETLSQNPLTAHRW